MSGIISQQTHKSPTSQASASAQKQGAAANLGIDHDFKTSPADLGEVKKHINSEQNAKYTRFFESLGKSPTTGDGYSSEAKQVIRDIGRGDGYSPEAKQVFKDIGRGDGYSPEAKQVIKDIGRGDEPRSPSLLTKMGAALFGLPGVVGLALGRSKSDDAR